MGSSMITEEERKAYDRDRKRAWRADVRSTMVSPITQSRADTQMKHIDWLNQNRKLWDGIINIDIPSDSRDAITRLAEEARKAGIFSPDVYIGDVRTRLIRALRALRSGL
jgi:flagellar biosynthesis regulator FlaF